MFLPSPKARGRELVAKLDDTQRAVEKLNEPRARYDGMQVPTERRGDTCDHGLSRSLPGASASSLRDGLGSNSSDAGMVSKIDAIAGCFGQRPVLRYLCSFSTLAFASTV